MTRFTGLSVASGRVFSGESDDKMVTSGKTGLSGLRLVGEIESRDLECLKRVAGVSRCGKSERRVALC